MLNGHWHGQKETDQPAQSVRIDTKEHNMIDCITRPEGVPPVCDFPNCQGCEDCPKQSPNTRPLAEVLEGQVLLSVEMNGVSVTH